MAGPYEVILEKAVKNLITALMTGVTEVAHRAPDPIVLQPWVLVILFYPDPHAYKAVWDYCVVPVLKQGIAIRSQDYLQQFCDMFKQKWAWPT